MSDLSKARKHAKKLRGKYAPDERVIDIKKVAEAEGIHVVEDKFDDDMSGLFMKEGGEYIIAVNTTHLEVRQRFTMAHELGHFILHKEESLHYDSMEPDMIFFRAEGKISAYETEANHFAASLLMPEEMVREDFSVSPEVDALAEKYEVSKSAMMYRLINLGLM